MENKPTYHFLFRGEKREGFMDAVMEFYKYTDVLRAELLEYNFIRRVQSTELG